MRSPSLLSVLPRVRANVPHAAGRAHTNLLIIALHRSPRQCPSTPACDRRVESTLLRWMFAHEDARLRPWFFTSPTVPSRIASQLLHLLRGFYLVHLFFKAMFPSAGAPLAAPGVWLPTWGLLDGTLIRDGSGKLRCAMRTWAHARKAFRNWDNFRNEDAWVSTLVRIERLLCQVPGKVEERRKSRDLRGGLRQGGQRDRTDETPWVSKLKTRFKGIAAIQRRAPDVCKLP